MSITKQWFLVLLFLLFSLAGILLLGRTFPSPPIKTHQFLFYSVDSNPLLSLFISILKSSSWSSSWLLCPFNISPPCFIDYAKAFDCVDHNKLWKILKEMGIPDHLTCLLRNLYTGQEATVRTGHRTTDRFQIGKGVCQGCILSPCLFNICRVHHEKHWAG